MIHKFVKLYILRFIKCQHFNFNLSLHLSLYNGAVREFNAAEDGGNLKAIGGILCQGFSESAHPYVLGCHEQSIQLRVTFNCPEVRAVVAYLIPLSLKLSDH